VHRRNSPSFLLQQGHFIGEHTVDSAVDPADALFAPPLAPTTDSPRPPSIAPETGSPLLRPIMDQMMGDGGRFPLEQWFWEMPICTRWWTTATVAVSALVQCQMVTPFQLFYSFRAVFVKNQVRSK